MNTLIIPCAGRSSRFPNMRPKYLLTHPDGQLMIEKSFSALDTDIFERILIVIVKEHDQRYNARLILEQCFTHHPKIEICVLETFTKSASETVARAITQMDVSGPIVIKDADNLVGAPLGSKVENAVVGYDIHEHPEVSNVAAKSFLVTNEQNIILNIVEKKIVSNLISLGIYCFEDSNKFVAAFRDMSERNIAEELYVSHVITHMIFYHKELFKCIMAETYEDWGTLEEWKKIQKKYSTYFIDFDGIVLKNSGRYGKENWKTNTHVITPNINTLQRLQAEGAQIVITTARPESYRESVESVLKMHGIVPYKILMGLHHAPRILINDFAPSNPYPSAQAVSLPRDSDISTYLT